GSWTQLTTFLPGYQFVTATDDGNSTANAMTMNTSPRLPSGDGVALVSLVVPVTNTSVDVTVSFDGDTALAIKTASGNKPAVGGLVAGMPIRGVVVGSEFRMRSDQAAAAVQAAAEAAQAAAEAAQQAAEDARDAAQDYAADAAAVTGLSRFSTVASLLADDNSEIGYAGRGAAIEVSAGVRGGVLDGHFVHEVTASTADPFDKSTNPNGYHLITAGGVKLYVLPGESGYHVKAFNVNGDGTDEYTGLHTAILVAGKKPLIFES